jgi:sulfatase maturation enzyme AslB (radical SAM superfamily)
LLTPQMSEELIAADIAHIVVSVTGNSEDVYSEFQGSNFERDKSDRLFYKVRENIKSFTKIRDSKKSKTQIGISYILTEDTKKDLVPAMRFYNDINVNYVDVRMQSGGYVADKTTFEDYLDTVVKPGDGIACTCYGKVMNLTTDGALSFCNCPEKQNIIGNVFETPITDIIGSERFLKLLDAFHGEYENIPEICKVCDIGRARPILA